MEGAAATHLCPCASLRAGRPSKSNRGVWICAQHVIQTLHGVLESSCVVALRLEGVSCGGAARWVPGDCAPLAHCTRTYEEVRALYYPLHPVVGRLGGGAVYAEGKT